MNIHQRISWFFEHNVTRWILIIAFVGLMTRAFFFSPNQSDYQYSHTETVEVVSNRPLETSLGTYRVLVSFQLEDGRYDTMTLHTEMTPDVNQQLDIDVLKRAGKKNRYRLAQDPIAP